MTGHSGVVLYGPPAAGKNTITEALTRLDHRYVLYEPLKAGGGRQGGYRSARPQRIAELCAAGELLYYVRRYSNLYAVDRRHLDQLVDDARVPVVHMGQLRGVRVLQAYPLKWLKLLLWVPRSVAAERLRRRGSVDIQQRLNAWDQTQDELVHGDSTCLDFGLRTDQWSIDEVAAAIIDASSGALLRPIAEILG